MLRRLNIRDECERIRYQSVWDESVRGGIIYTRVESILVKEGRVQESRV